MLDRRQTCPDCGRNYSGEDDADVQPGCDCPAEDCPSNGLGQNDGEVGMICEDMCDGGFVKLDKPHESWVWECAVWGNGRWYYEGDRIHLSNLRRVPNPIPEMTKK